MKGGSEITIRQERPGDERAVWHVNSAAFGQPDEADLVDRLRKQAGPYLAFVAEVEGAVVGHIAFTPVTLDARPDLDLRGLAPMAVLPGHQRLGVGSALVRAGLAACREDGAHSVVVLGHPAYYPRFGFRSADAFGLTCEYDVPREAFMTLELYAGSLDGVEGTVRYHQAFGG